MSKLQPKRHSGNLSAGHYAPRKPEGSEQQTSSGKDTEFF
jgi:hypothetical protein